jgi:hypothetical protein
MTTIHTMYDLWESVDISTLSIAYCQLSIGKTFVYAGKRFTNTYS